MRNCLDFVIHLVNMTRFSVLNTHLELWRMLVQLLSMIVIFSRRKYLSLKGQIDRILFFMNLVICGSATWLQCNGGTTFGLMKVSQNSFLISANLRSKQKRLQELMFGFHFMRERYGVTLKTNCRRPTLYIVRLITRI